jgi:hypothetical protein
VVRKCYECGKCFTNKKRFINHICSNNNSIGNKSFSMDSQFSKDSEIDPRKNISVDMPEKPGLFSYSSSPSVISSSSNSIIPLQNFGESFVQSERDSVTLSNRLTVNE